MTRPQSDLPRQAYDTLRADIVDGRMAPGTTLGEVELAARLGMSRTPVREALKQLTHEGLVSSEPGRSAMVATLSIEQAGQLFQAMEAVEVYLVRMATRAPGRTGMRELADEFAVVAVSDPLDIREAVRLLDEYRRAVHGNSNAYLTRFVADLHGQLGRMRRIVATRPDRVRILLGLYQRLCLAVDTGAEMEAVRLTTTIIELSLRTVLDVLGGGLLGPIEDVG